MYNKTTAGVHAVAAVSIGHWRVEPCTLWTQSTPTCGACRERKSSSTGQTGQ